MKNDTGNIVSGSVFSTAEAVGIKNISKKMDFFIVIFVFLLYNYVRSRKNRRFFDGPADFGLDFDK